MFYAATWPEKFALCHWLLHQNPQHGSIQRWRNVSDGGQVPQYLGSIYESLLAFPDKAGAPTGAICLQSYPFGNTNDVQRTMPRRTVAENMSGSRSACSGFEAEVHGAGGTQAGLSLGAEMTNGANTTFGGATISLPWQHTFSVECASLPLNARTSFVGTVPSPPQYCVVPPPPQLRVVPLPPQLCSFVRVLTQPPPCFPFNQAREKYKAQNMARERVRTATLRAEQKTGHRRENTEGKPRGFAVT